MVSSPFVDILNDLIIIDANQNHLMQLKIHNVLVVRDQSVFVFFSN